jgi:hypothetical protein
MKINIQKLYNRKRPAHPADNHTKSKRWFKKQGRKSTRKYFKNELRKVL